jgi:hypothetical protein
MKLGALVNLQHLTEVESTERFKCATPAVVVFARNHFVTLKFVVLCEQMDSYGNLQTD